jgi:hypothetical protein
MKEISKFEYSYERNNLNTENQIFIQIINS